MATPKVTAHVFNNTNPAEEAVSVTPNDSTDLTGGLARALFIGGSGNVALHTYSGTSVTFVGLVAGTILPIRAKRVLATNTTATNIVALY